MTIKAYTCTSCVESGAQVNDSLAMGKASICQHETSTRGYAYCLGCSLTKRKCHLCGDDMPRGAKTRLIVPASPKPRAVSPIKSSAKKRR